MAAAVSKCGRVSARINGLAVVLRPRLGPRAEQRESKVVGALEVCAKALQHQRAWLESTNRCPDPGLAHNFGLHPWIDDGRGG
jgi:hypothetical protein